MNGKNKTHPAKPTEQEKCSTVTVMKLATIAVHMLVFTFAIVLCNALHIILRPFSQPRIISEAIVGICLSNLPFIRSTLHDEAKRTLAYVVDFGMICHMFVVGLEVDRNIFVNLPFRDAKVACSGVFITFILAMFITPVLNVCHIRSIEIDLAISFILSGTASPLLARLMTDLKIGKSDIGQFVVSAGVISDLLSTLLLSLGFIMVDPYNGFKFRTSNSILLMGATLVIQTVLAAKLMPILMIWVTRENPQGKSIKGSHLIVSIASLVLICSLSPVVGRFNKVLSAFLAGVAMPREGRISKMMIGKVRYFFSILFFPAFFFWVGFETEFSKFGGRQLGTWAKLVFLYLITIAGKVAGSVVSGVMLGFHWKESVAIGLLLSIKGHFHVYLVLVATRMELVSRSTSMVMIMVIFLTFIYTPLIVRNIIERARKRSPTQRMALQWLNSTDELRVVLCLHGPQNIQAIINFMEISQGPPDPGMVAYVTDMIELTEKIAASIARGQGVDSMTVTDKGVIEMREQITNAIQGYVDEDCDGISVRRMLALTPLPNMHQDICALAEDLLVSLIILPFHKDQTADGRLSAGHYAAFRSVNRKVLRYAPCSVGILVDRGLGTTQISRAGISLNAAVIFIGGKDDREALAYAGRVARHPGVKLTVIRFLLDSNSESVTSRITRARANSAEYEEEMKLDDEYFAEFYDRYVAGGRVAYMEKYLVNSGQTFTTIRSLEGQYDLFIVGRAGRVNSVLTAGMNDWEECPELGPIGDILSASDFSVTASVLVIQQHNLKGELQGLHEEFSIM